MNNVSNIQTYNSDGVSQSVPIHTSETTSDAVQAKWDEQMAVISDIVTRMNAVPSQAQQDDLRKLVGALKELTNLAENGIKDKTTGETTYMSTRMAEALQLMLSQFAVFGITPTMTIPENNSIDILNKAAKPGVDPKTDPLQVSVASASDLTNETLGLQSYLYAAIMGQVMPAYNAQFKDLYDYMELTEKTLSTLDDLKKIGTYQEIGEVWGYDMTLNNSACIPPTAVDGIQAYIEKNGGSDAQKKFASTYKSEYSQAEALAKKNGTTVEEEMKNFHGASDILKDFCGWEKDPNRAADVAKIMADSVVQEVDGVATPPPGMTMSDVGEEIWDAKKELDVLIGELKTQGADPKLIDSLQTISDDIDDLWTQSVEEFNNSGYGSRYNVDTTTPENVSGSNHDAMMGIFAKNFIEKGGDSKSGGSISSHIDEAMQRFQTLNEDQQKDFKKLMTYMDQLMKMVGMMMKSIDDAYKKIISGFKA